MITARYADIPLKTASKLIHIPAWVNKNEITELRLRAGRKAMITVGNRCIPCSETISKEEIEQCFQELCQHSVHSFAREISEGYITLPAGHRVGFCGTAIIDRDKIETLKDISSINIRIAREVVGCAEELYHSLFSQGVRSLLLAGKPLSGKTTVLRDLARILGADHRVAVIDSRNEIAAVHKGTPSLSIGDNTDVLTGYPKHEGILTAIRTLSPEIIICDEIGDDADAVKQCIHCGVKLVASAHADSIKELYQRPDTAELLPMFECAAVLSGKGKLADIKITGGATV